MARVVVDTNIVISAILFGGKPRKIFKLIVTKRVEAITSPPLLAELLDVIAKKFHFPKKSLNLLQKKIKQNFLIVYPVHEITLLQDIPDNRVLEAAIEGECSYIITGDKELLALGSFKDVQILSANEFLKRL